jgi:hypothetical protein
MVVLGIAVLAARTGGTTQKKPAEGSASVFHQLMQRVPRDGPTWIEFGTVRGVIVTGTCCHASQPAPTGRFIESSERWRHVDPARLNRDAHGPLKVRTA